MPSRLDWIDDKLRVLAARHLRRARSTRVGPQGAVIELDGQSLVNFAANDYLGLAGDPRLAQAARDALADVGWGSGASPLLAGYSTYRRRLEDRLAEFLGVEAALVMNSGYAANVGTIAAMVGPGDDVFSDAHNHASIIDGCRLSRAEIHVYHHADTDHLASLLRAAPPRGRRLIVTDTIFSMDGDVAPLAELAAIADEHGAMLMLDEAHATGVFGVLGRGLAEARGIERRVDIHVGTLSKALGGSGGFVAGSARLVEWLVNRARSYVFSTAAPAANDAAARCALDLVRDEPHRRHDLLARAAQLRDELAAQGWNLGRSTTHIIPLIVGESSRALELAARLRAAGVYAPAIRPPTVPPGRACLRLSLTASHTPEQRTQLVTLLAAARSDFLAP